MHLQFKAVFFSPCLKMCIQRPSNAKWARCEMCAGEVRRSRYHDSHIHCSFSCSKEIDKNDAICESSLLDSTGIFAMLPIIYCTLTLDQGCLRPRDLTNHRLRIRLYVYSRSHRLDRAQTKTTPVHPSVSPCVTLSPQKGRQREKLLRNNAE